MGAGEGTGPQLDIRHFNRFYDGWSQPYRSAHDLKAKGRMLQTVASC
jgi:hypothetical protein